MRHSRREISLIVDIVMMASAIVIAIIMSLPPIVLLAIVSLGAILIYSLLRRKDYKNNRYNSEMALEIKETIENFDEKDFLDLVHIYVMKYYNYLEEGNLHALRDFCTEDFVAMQSDVLQVSDKVNIKDKEISEFRNLDIKYEVDIYLRITIMMLDSDGEQSLEESMYCATLEIGKYQLETNRSMQIDDIEKMGWKLARLENINT